jgi:hypothetical protein
MSDMAATRASYGLDGALAECLEALAYLFARRFRNRRIWATLQAVA